MFWNPSNAHAQPLKRIRAVALCLILSLVQYFVCVNREGSGETVQISRLAWAFAICLIDKYPFKWTGSFNGLKWLTLDGWGRYYSKCICKYGNSWHCGPNQTLDGTFLCICTVFVNMSRINNEMNTPKMVFKNKKKNIYFFSFSFLSFTSLQTISLNNSGFHSTQFQNSLTFLNFPYQLNVHLLVQLYRLKETDVSRDMTKPTKWVCI